MREDGRYRRIHGNALDLAGIDLAQHLLEALEIERLLKNILHDLADQRMVGDLNWAVGIFLAGRDIRKD